MITLATYNVTSGVLVVTGTGFLSKSGTTNDIDITKLSILGDVGSYTLTTASTQDVEITSATSFTVTLGTTDKTAVALRLTKNGTISTGSVTYNLAGGGGLGARGRMDGDHRRPDQQPHQRVGQQHHAGDHRPERRQRRLDHGHLAHPRHRFQRHGHRRGKRPRQLERFDADGQAVHQRRRGGRRFTDTFTLNALGFTLSGSNLQTSGQTFATYTSTGGVLTVNFANGGANATNALVQAVIRAVRYSSTTSYGDAKIRFTLNDGTTSTTADVAVTSATITVDRTDDDSDGDAADGFSLREALARSVAQATADTINLNAIDGSTATLTGSVATLGTGDKIQLSKSAATVTIAGSGGGGLALAGASTLDIQNSNTSLIISANISGVSGSILKLNGGALTLSGTNTYGGATQFNNGAITLTGGSAIPDASAVTFNSPSVTTLSNSNETIGSLAGDGTIATNGYTLTTGGNNTDTTFAGVISGTGGLTKTGTGVLTLTGTNTYTGTTTVSAAYVSSVLTGGLTLSAAAARRWPTAARLRSPAS